jgi:hypothetical protein
MIAFFFMAASHRQYLLVLAIIFFVEWVALAIHPHFAYEWAESLRVKHPQPLGEEAIKRLLRE